MPKQKIPYYVNLGGLVLRKNDPLVEGKEATIADNVLFRIWGEIRQRDGFLAQITSPVSNDKVRVIHQHAERASNTKTRLVLRGNTISKFSAGVETVLDDTLTSSNILGASAQLFDDSVICTGADKPRAFSTALGIETIDTQDFKPQWCISYKNYMVYGGDAVLPQRIVFSALGNAKSVNANLDFIDILDADQRITGAFVLFNSLFITSVATIIKIDGSDFQATSDGFNAQVTPIWHGDGSVNHQSIVVAHDRAYFLGLYTIYEFDGRSVNDISDMIEPFIRDKVNSAAIANSVSVHDEANNIVIISVPSLSTSIPDTHFVYHYETALMCWSKWTGFTTTYWYAMREGGEYPIAWHGDTDGQLFRHGGEVDDINDTAQTVKVAIDYRYKTGWQGLNDPAMRFIMKHVYPIVNGVSGDTFDVYFYKNYSSNENSDFPKTLTIPPDGPIWGVMVWGSFIWGGSDKQYAPRVGVAATVCKNYSLEFRHSSLGKRFTISGWTTTVIPKGLTDGN